MIKVIFLSFFIYIFLNLQAYCISFQGKLEQGGLVYGWVEPGTVLNLDEKKIIVSKTGFFVFGLSRNSPLNVSLEIIKDDRVSTEVIEIKKRVWRVERIDGLPKRTVSPNKEILGRIRLEGSLISNRRKKSKELMYFEKGFILPAKGRVSGVFGSQRILNGKPRSPHSGLDLAAPIGTPVKATSDGIVTLVHNEMVLTGKTLMVDHGLGLNSIYIHLNDIFVEEGEFVKQGQKIAEIGVTGRTSGPHLHFGITWFGIKLDPEAVLSALPPK